jgi:hypothetical protein
MSVDEDREKSFKETADFVYELLVLQTVILRDDQIFLCKDKNVNSKALGYVFGFLDAFLQVKGLDIRNSEGQPIMLYLLSRLVPKEVESTGSYVIYLQSHMRDDPDVLNGVQLGGKQALDFINKKAPIMGFAKSLLEYSHPTKT